VLIEGDNQKLCEKFNWGAGKKCYTQKFGVVVPTPKPTPVPTPKPTPDKEMLRSHVARMEHFRL